MLRSQCEDHKKKYHGIIGLEFVFSETVGKHFTKFVVIVGKQLFLWLFLWLFLFVWLFL